LPEPPPTVFHMVSEWLSISTTRRIRPLHTFEFDPSTFPKGTLGCATRIIGLRRLPWGARDSRRYTPFR